MCNLGEGLYMQGYVEACEELNEKHRRTIEEKNSQLAAKADELVAKDNELAAQAKLIAELQAKLAVQ